MCGSCFQWSRLKWGVTLFDGRRLRSRQLHLCQRSVWPRHKKPGNWIRVYGRPEYHRHTSVEIVWGVSVLIMLSIVCLSVCDGSSTYYQGHHTSADHLLSVPLSRHLPPIQSSASFSQYLFHHFQIVELKMYLFGCYCLRRWMDGYLARLLRSVKIIVPLE